MKLNIRLCCLFITFYMCSNQMQANKFTDLTLAQKLLAEQIDAQYPSYVDSNHYGLCLRAKYDLPKGIVVATANFEKTDKPFIMGHEDPEHKYVALMDVTKDGQPVYGKVRGKWAFCNHSCDPNCDVTHTWHIVTNRNICKDQELTTSYDSYVPNFPWQENWNFVCLCESPHCKKIINEYRMDIVWPIGKKE